MANFCALIKLFFLTDFCGALELALLQPNAGQPNERKPGKAVTAVSNADTTAGKWELYNELNN